MHFGLRELIFLVVLIAMPVSSFWFVFRPQNAEIEQAKLEIQHKEQMLEKLSKATAQNDDLERANAEIAEGISMVESRLPDTKEVEVVLEQVASLARESKLELAKVRTGKPVPSSRYMEQPLEMTISGDFDDFYAFLLKVEELPRITRMPDLKVKKIDKVDGSMEASFTLSIYFEPEASSASAGPGQEKKG